MSLDNNSANNFKDFLDAIKPYLNYQPVDLSCMGIDAFQFSTDEKPVGMWTDRKIVYAKTVTGTSASSSSSSATLATIQNVDTFIYAYGDCVCNSNDKRSTPNVSSSFEFVGNDLRFYTNSDSMFGKTINAIMFYTKTTDSPLSSDEKFAGVTSGGEVIYEQEFSTTEITSDNYYAVNLSYGKLLDVKGYADLYAGSELNGCVTFPQTILAGAYSGVYINVKSNMAKTNVTVYFKDGRTGTGLTPFKLKNVNFTVRYTKTS